MNQKTGRRRVVITGMGAVTPLGNSVAAFWEGLKNGRSGIGPITRFDATDYAARIAGEVRDFNPEDHIDKKMARRMDPFTHFAVAASAMALDNAELTDLDRFDRNRIGVVVGSGIGGMQTFEGNHTNLVKSGPRRISPFFIPMMIADIAPGYISIIHGLKGPNYATMSACATATHAIGDACRIIERDDRGSTEAALEENLKRKDLNPLEKAMAFQDYRDRFGCSIEELAKKLSMKRSTVSNFLRLLELPDVVKESLSQDRISNGHARALLSVSQDEQRIELCRRIERESLSVRATEAEIRKLLKSEGTIPFPKKDGHSPAPGLTSHLRSLQEQLRQQLGAKVEIRPSGKEQGKIVIHFQSNDDFESILRQLRRAA